MQVSVRYDLGCGVVIAQTTTGVLWTWSLNPRRRRSFCVYRPPG